MDYLGGGIYPMIGALLETDRTNTREVNMKTSKKVVSVSQETESTRN